MGGTWCVVHMRYIGGTARQARSRRHEDEFGVQAGLGQAAASRWFQGPLRTVRVLSAYPVSPQTEDTRLRTPYSYIPTEDSRRAGSAENQSPHTPSATD